MQGFFNFFHCITPLFSLAQFKIINIPLIKYSCDLKNTKAYWKHYFMN